MELGTGRDRTASAADCAGSASSARCLPTLSCRGWAQRQTVSMIQLPPEVVSQLPVDELALQVLLDLLATKQWNEHNFLLGVSRSYSGEAAEAIAEAYMWLKAKAYVARPPDGGSDNAIFVTRSGRRVASGIDTLRVEERLRVGLHPVLDRAVRRQFLLGEFEQGVFVAMRAVEIRVRRLSGLGDDVVGVDLMTQAFKPKGGVLTDTGSPRGEQEGLMALFRGAYAVLRNPVGHREVDYRDVTEAAEAASTASMLMRILDRVEARLAPH